MKKILFLITLVLVSNSCFTQTKQETDSLYKVAVSGQDTAKVMALCMLSFYEHDPARGLQLVNEALILTRKIKFEMGEAQCFHQLGNHFSGIADYPRALEYHLKALQKREQIQDLEGIATSTYSIGTVYKSLENYAAALTYYFKAIEILKKVNKPYRFISPYASIAGVYENQKKHDSALIYYNRSYEYGMTSAGKYYLSNPLTGLGNVQAALGNKELALSFYRKSIENALIYNNAGALGNACLSLSQLFSKTGNKDSAIYYANRAMKVSENGQLKRLTVNAAKQLSQLYEQINDKEALRYHKMAMDANDSIFSASNTAQIQNMTFSEQERQREINENKIKEEAERKHNLQYAAIALGLIAFVTLFLLLSHSIIANQKLISFLGVVALLIVFEFINLYIHPYLAHVTNDSPLLMLLVMVCIAALLVPVHHRLEKWITNRLVEKNKRIRLAAARNTIARLEGTSPQ